MNIHIVNKKVASLKEKGLKENKDFRVIYYKDEAEIKILNFSKLVRTKTELNNLSSF